MKSTTGMGMGIFFHGMSFPKNLSNMSFLPYIMTAPKNPHVHKINDVPYLTQTI